VSSRRSIPLRALAASSAQPLTAIKRLDVAGELPAGTGARRTISYHSGLLSGALAN
jgi:hypothetical protein